MTGDVLAPFRRSGSAPPPPRGPAPQTPAAGYRAFGVAADGARPLRLDIRPRDGLAVARLYSGLNEIAYDRAGYTGILLVYAAKLVKLRGRNLRPVVEALLAGTCEYVAEPGDGEEPQEGAPVIDRIELMTASAAGASPQSV